MAGTGASLGFAPVVAGSHFHAVSSFGVVIIIPFTGILILCVILRKKKDRLLSLCARPINHHPAGSFLNDISFASIRLLLQGEQFSYKAKVAVASVTLATHTRHLSLHCNLRIAGQQLELWEKNLRSAMET